MSDSQEKTFGELLSEGIGKMKTDLAAALAANQRLEKERDEARKLVEEYSQDLMTQREVAAELHATISAERDRLMADVVQCRRALEEFTEDGICSCIDFEGDGSGHGHCIYCRAREALATEHPGAPLVEAVGKACESLKFAIADGRATISDKEALALLTPFAPHENQ